MHCGGTAKSRKDSTSTLSLVINRVKLKENLPKNVQGWGGGPLKAINFESFLSFTLDFFYPWRLHCYIFTPPGCRTTMVRFFISYRVSTFRAETLILGISLKERLGGERRPENGVKKGWICIFLYYIANWYFFPSVWSVSDLWIHLKYMLYNLKTNLKI